MSKKNSTGPDMGTSGLELALRIHAHKEHSMKEPKRQKALKPAVVRFHTVLRYPFDVLPFEDLALIKIYSMLSEDVRPYSHSELLCFGEYILGELRRCPPRLDMGATNPKKAKGFAIVSEGILNIAVWGADKASEFPKVSYPNISAFERKNIVYPLGIRYLEDDGGFCVDEAQILAFEGRAWREFHNSRRGIEDQLKYLKTAFRGTIA
jgi:hypothetical protein